MRRALRGLLAGGLALGLAGTAGAAITEVGMTTDQTPPSCPASPCVVISRTTGFQARQGSLRAPFAAPRAGRIAAWTITESQPSPVQVKYFDAMEGGPAAAAIAVLRPGPKYNYTLAAQSPTMPLEAYFGTTVQFPLEVTLPVNAGDVIALSVPTWAPALALGFGADTSWRASRGRTACASTSLTTTQPAIGSSILYYCLYTTARLTYSATLISAPVAPTSPPLTIPAAPVAVPVAPPAGTAAAPGAGPPRAAGRPSGR